MASSAEWATGYARQARADFLTFRRLRGDGSVPECHELQFLQMACEKLVKAYLCGRGQTPATLQASHAYVAGVLPVVLQQQATFLRFTGPRAREVLRHAGHLAREIELLAPAVRRGGLRPDNCEYPWEDAGGNLRVPLDWSFACAQLIASPAGRNVVELIRGAIDRLLPAPS